MLGDILKKAREEMGVTQSEAAAETRMKVQHVEALENEDFSKVAAPAYAKGFIRLYSDYLGIDSEPLLQEYVDQFMPRESTVLLPGDDGSDDRSGHGDTGPGFSLSRLREIEWPFTFSKLQVAGVAGGLAVLILLIMLLSMMARSKEDVAEEISVEALPTTDQASPSKPVLIQGPPEPFIDLYEQR